MLSWKVYNLNFINNKGANKTIKIQLQSYGNKTVDDKALQEYIDTCLVPEYDIKQVISLKKYTQEEREEVKDEQVQYAVSKRADSSAVQCNNR